MSLESEFFNAICRFGSGDGCTVQDLVALTKRYAGPGPHLLWSEYDEQFIVYAVFQELSLEKAAELFGALVADDPTFPLIKSGDGRRAILGAAMRGMEGKMAARAAVDVVTLLAVPETARMPVPSRGYRRNTLPLHLACEDPGVDPAIIHHLLDLDPEALRCETDTASSSGLPLHFAFAHNPTGSFIKRMIDQRPESLLWKDSL
jgi:hypothetical protein